MPGVESSYPEPSQKVRQVAESGRKRKIGRYCAINSNTEKEQHAVYKGADSLLRERILTETQHAPRSARAEIGREPVGKSNRIRPMVATGDGQPGTRTAVCRCISLRSGAPRARPGSAQKFSHPMESVLTTQSHNREQ